MNHLFNCVLSPYVRVPYVAEGNYNEEPCLSIDTRCINCSILEAVFASDIHFILQNVLKLK